MLSGSRGGRLAGHRARVRWGRGSLLSSCSLAVGRLRHLHTDQQQRHASHPSRPHWQVRRLVRLPLLHARRFDVDAGTDVCALAACACSGDFVLRPSVYGGSWARVGSTTIRGEWSSAGLDRRHRVSFRFALPVSDPARSPQAGPHSVGVAPVDHAPPPLASFAASRTSRVHGPFALPAPPEQPPPDGGHRRCPLVRRGECARTSVFPPHHARPMLTRVLYLVGQGLSWSRLVPDRWSTVQAACKGCGKRHRGSKRQLQWRDDMPDVFRSSDAPA